MCIVKRYVTILEGHIVQKSRHTVEGPSHRGRSITPWKVHHTVEGPSHRNLVHRRKVSLHRGCFKPLVNPEKSCTSCPNCSTGQRARVP
jgi:hypothetical protein